MNTGPWRNVMPKVDGRSFRCECGCNVFSTRDPNDHPNPRYKCNGCGEMYTAERRVEELETR